MAITLIPMFVLAVCGIVQVGQKVLSESLSQSGCVARLQYLLRVSECVCVREGENAREREKESVRVSVSACCACCV